MLFPERPINLEHIRAFCIKFNEGYRVEYKSLLNAAVREKIPTVLSSFANSHGGVLIVGVETKQGVPQSPFEGFEPPPREELALTIENLCLQNIYPPIFPRTTVIPSDRQNRVFLIIEIDESDEAPHAIENSRKVYVRTGNAGNPYDLADVDSVIELVRRRKKPLEQFEHILGLAEDRANLNIPRNIEPFSPRFLQISICPRFPGRALCSISQLWDFISRESYRGGRFFPGNATRRVPYGVGAVIPGQGSSHFGASYSEINKYGLIMKRQVLPLTNEQYNGVQELGIRFSEIFHSFLPLTACAERFYACVGYRGGLLISLTLENVGNTLMRFDSDSFTAPPLDCRCYSNSVATQRIVGVDELGSQDWSAFAEILAEVAWAFWQSRDEFPTDRFTQHIWEWIAKMAWR
jgi:hypothetical protein